MIGLGEIFSASCVRNDVANEAQVVEKAHTVMRQNAGVSDPELIIRDGYVLAKGTGKAGGLEHFLCFLNQLRGDKCAVS